jgi:hypothetical protein
LAQPPKSAGHGPEFCEIYLQLAYRYMGDRMGASLEERFKAHRVQVAPSAVPLRRICLRRHSTVTPRQLRELERQIWEERLPDE